jgi:hypothetical protein
MGADASSRIDQGPPTRPALGNLKDDNAYNAEQPNAQGPPQAVPWDESTPPEATVIPLKAPPTGNCVLPLQPTQTTEWTVSKFSLQWAQWCKEITIWQPSLFFNPSQTMRTMFVLQRICSKNSLPFQRSKNKTRLPVTRRRIPKRNTLLRAECLPCSINNLLRLMVMPCFCPPWCTPRLWSTLVFCVSTLWTILGASPFLFQESHVT